jgi:phosphoesterase RecJ-like protein
MSDMQNSRPSALAAHLEPLRTELGQLLPEEPWEAVAKLIRRSHTVLLICHVSPDGDAIGSLLGLGLGLRNLGKQVTLACESALPPTFSFLPGFESIVNSVDVASFDLVIGLDSSDPSRLGNVYDTKRLAGIPLINIDHHTTNLFFGDINLVVPRAASTAEIVLTLLDHLGVSIDQNVATQSASPANANIGATFAPTPGVVENHGISGDSLAPVAPGIATCLLTGIITDTLSFRTSNVTPPVMRAALRLMEAGASLAKVTHYVSNQRPLVELRLLAYGLKRIETAVGLAWSEIRLADRQACGYDGDSDVGLVGMLARTKEVQMAAVFSEKENNEVEVSFRADPGFDVAQLALSLGGGGHPAAAGCTIEGSLEAAKARVLPMLRAALDEQRKSAGV